MTFADRTEAGRLLGELLVPVVGSGDVVVLGLARGGVPVAAAAARVLGRRADVLVVRKLGVPGHAELAMGAVASGGVRVVNRPVVEALGLSDEVLDAATRRELAELRRREERYRGRRPAPDLSGRTVVVIDDGLATGSTMRAAVAAVRAQGAVRVIAGLPVGSRPGCAELSTVVDALVCPEMPDDFGAVGAWYEDFTPTTDREIEELLRPDE